MNKTKTPKSILSISLRIMIPICCAMVALFLIACNNLGKARKVACTYMSNTAELFVERIKEDVSKIYSEVYDRFVNSSYFEIWPKEMVPQEMDYKIAQEILTDNIVLKQRYGEEYTFFVYGMEADLLFCDTTVYYKGEYESELIRELRKCLQEIGNLKCELIYVEDKPYLVNVYVKANRVFGYYIDLELLLKDLEMNNMGYRMIPYVRWEDGGLITSGSAEDVEKIEYSIENAANQNGLLSEMICSYPISKNFTIEVLLIPDNGILEGIVNMQLVLLLISAGFLLVVGFGGTYLYLSVIRPIRQFIVKLQNPEVELFLNSTESFNMTELEMVSREFKELLKRIKTLKIAVYERELMASEVQMEYVKEQMQSHFYLNCMSILHGMAEQNRDRRMTDFLKLLHGYMRYVNNDSYKMKTLREELDHIEGYVAIQQVRYKDAFTYQVDVEEGLWECYLPTLVLQTFVENAFKHALTSQRQVSISLFVTTELREQEEYLYIIISDTGRGFSEESLEAIRQGDTIYYDDRKHTGIANTKQRLQLIYGDKASLKLSNMAKDYGGVVELRLPLSRKEGAGNESIDRG